MATHVRIDPTLLDELLALYEEVMWLAARPKVTPSMARAWYTHVVAGRFRLRIRHFSGKVSHAAASDPLAVLRLEHYSRIQTKLTALVGAHRKAKRPKPEEFIRMILECEKVHIVTFAENYDAMRAGGDCRKAGIRLLSWHSIPRERRQVLWSRMLRSKVANAGEFSLHAEPRAAHAKR
ncbi:MAG: hypothetical protein NTX84_03385 [Nitrospirae bacterium]|nr:hypothetical protein [Nitrospirota bacterium]